MSDKIEKKQTLSFGKIFILFLLFFLIALFIISLQTSTKLEAEHEKEIESSLASTIDRIFSETTESGYVYKHFDKVVQTARKFGVESSQVEQAIKENYISNNISAKYFFYKNNEFVKAYNHNNEDLDLFTDLFILMS